MFVVFHRLHLALPRTIEAVFFFLHHFYATSLSGRLVKGQNCWDEHDTKPLAHICIQELTSLFLLIRIVQRLNSLYLLPALNPVSYSEKMIFDVVVRQVWKEARILTWKEISILLWSRVFFASWIFSFPYLLAVSTFWHPLVASSVTRAHLSDLV